MQSTDTYRVLIVDDNEAIHRDFRSLLESKIESGDLLDLALEVFGEAVGSEPTPDLPRYEFDSAYQGPDALETVKQASSTGQSYTLAFVDVRMPPGWDGVETIQRLWEVDPNIQMIICSAYADYSWDQIVQELGVTDKLLLLRKPFDPNSVKQMALAVVCRWNRDRKHRERIAELEALVGRHGQELDRLRPELDRLSAEMQEMRTLRDGNNKTRAERVARMRTEVLAIIAALELVLGSSLSEAQRAAAESALKSGRALLEELGRAQMD
jgi:CheY-like chemotaxis protein